MDYESNTATDYSDTNVTELSNGLQPLRFSLNGKIDERRFHGGKYYTSVLTPALDEYSQPSIIEVRSEGTFGDKGEVVSDVQCTVSGYLGKPFQATNKDTGERVTTRRVNHVVDLIE